MNLCIEQKLFTWGDQFSIYDINGNVAYYAKGEIFTFGKKLHIFDPSGYEVAYIEQKLFSFLPKYYIHRSGRGEIAEVVKEFTFFRQEYSVRPMGWKVCGDIFAHEYEIWAGGLPVAAISKDWFRWGDAYEINIGAGADPVMALSVVLVIDACIDAQQD
ncbi:MAG: LURP-one-related/scramblase family protein [Eubacteriales bacterium]